MRLAAQAIDDPQLDPGERGEGGIVEFDDIGRIGDPPMRKPSVVLKPWLCSNGTTGMPATLNGPSIACGTKAGR